MIFKPKTRVRSVRSACVFVLTFSCATMLAQTLALATTAIAQTTPTAPPAMSGHASADAAQMLVNFITSVNRDGIAMGKLALTKASNSNVRAYAQRLVDDHTNAMTAWADKVPSLSLSIPDSAKTAAKPAKATAGSAAMANGMSEVRDTTTGLRGGTSAAAVHSGSLATRETLKGLSGAAFDHAFLSAQQTAQVAVLKELTMQPATYDDMQTLLTIFRSTIEKHQAEARKLQP